jgi:hypothetical protein
VASASIRAVFIQRHADDAALMRLKPLIAPA